MNIENPIIIDDYKKFYEGTVFTSSEGDRYQITEYVDTTKVKIKFLDGFDYENYFYLSAVKAGNVKNPYHPGVYGGYVGVGPYSRSQNEIVYGVWGNMIERCRKNNPGYENVTVCTEWYNFQNFATWMYDQFKYVNGNFHYQIDKDLLQWNQKNKVYSPSTCCLLPDIINNTLSGLHYEREKNDLPVGVNRIGINGLYNATITITNNGNKESRNLGNYRTPVEAFYAYKIEKEKIIKQLAEEYYRVNAIPKHIYDKLYSIKVESDLLTESNFNSVKKSSEQQKAEYKPKQFIPGGADSYVGMEFDTTDGRVKVLEREQGKYYTIQFLDDGSIIHHKNIDNIKMGNAKNPYKKNRYGGFMGEGKYNSGKNNSEYKAWDGMMKVVFDKDDHEVCNDWRNFQIFTDWYINYKSQLNPNYQYEFNRNIFQWRSSTKICSPETCCIVPKDFNRQLVGTEFGFGNNHITCGDPVRTQKYRDQAKEYYEQGAITKDVYDKICTLDI